MTCPICSTSVPKTFIQSHTEDCLARSQKPSQPISNQQEPRKTQKIASTQSPTGLPAHTSTQRLHTPALGQPQKSPAKAAAAAASNAAPFLSPRQRLPPDEFKALVSASWDRALRHLPEALEEVPAQQQQQKLQQQQPLNKPTLHDLSTAQHAGGAGGAGAAAAGAEGAVDAFAVLKSAQVSAVIPALFMSWCSLSSNPSEAASLAMPLAVWPVGAAFVLHAIGSSSTSV